MNQILSVKRNIKKVKKYRLLLLLSLALIIILLIYEAYIYYNLYQKENVSQNIINSFNLIKLYSSSEEQHYTISKLNDTKEEDNSFYVIGIIEIPKISIKYPILSTCNDELLKIAPCRFYGPSPNEVGNLCIAAHNYDDDRFFGNLKYLNIGDKICIYDSNNFVRYYYIYNKFEINDKDTSCTMQNTNNLREITLVTCNNLNKKRLVVKAKEHKNEDYT